MTDEIDSFKSGETDRSRAVRVLSQAESSILTRTGLEPLLKVAELAELAGQSQRTILRRVADGTIPARRLGGRAIRVSRRSALHYLNGADDAGPASSSSEAGLEGGTDMEQLKGYRVYVREVVEYEVMLLAESADDAKAIVETENPELDGGSSIEDGTPHRTVSLQAIGVEPYPDLE